MTADEFNQVYDLCLDGMEQDDRMMVVMLPGANGLVMVQATLHDRDIPKAYSPRYEDRGRVALRAVLSARALVGM